MGAFIMINKTESSPRICILVDRVGVSAFHEGKILSGWEEEFIEGKLKRAGILRSEVIYESISPNTSYPTSDDSINCINRLNAIRPTVIVTTGEKGLTLLTGKRSLWKWHLSPLDVALDLSVGASVAGFSCRKVIPTFHPSDVRKQWDLSIYVELAFRRAREESSTRDFVRKTKRFLLNPRIDETFEVLAKLNNAPDLSIDIETGGGQINTVGFAWTASDAIAINVLPDNFGPENYKRLWEAIRRLVEGPAQKIFQNAIYEIMYFSQYGINVGKVWHDTMIAQKFLYPELDKGLANVGRMYTNEPYWKDTGKEVDGESEKRDWANIKDWPRHYLYNCLDTSGTFEAAFNQSRDLKARGMDKLFYNYVMEFFGPVSEMCVRGLPINPTIKEKLYAANEEKVEALTKSLSAEINPGSWQQKLRLFKDKGYTIPKKRDTKTGLLKESTDELSLKKILLKHPEDTDIPRLLEIAELSKANSSYLGADISADGFVRYMLCIHGTETGRFSCTKDHQYRGFNAQTIPSYAKKMIEWSTDSGRLFIQCDLKQAESRFVAYDSADENLIRALEDPGRDIHSEVAHQIIKTLGVDVSGVSPDEFKKKWRQLGKKSGHGANYAMQEGTFIESCLKEMDLVLTKKEAAGILEAYHALFPGIRRLHRTVQQEIRNKRMLTNPFGRVRYFYGRVDDTTFREGYAYRPQSTVPDIVNHLMLELYKKRSVGELKFWFHNQVHDSLVLSAKIEDITPIAMFMKDIKQWHPPIKLLAGDLWIPTDVEVGANLGGLKAWNAP